MGAGAPSSPLSAGTRHPQGVTGRAIPSIPSALGDQRAGLSTGLPPPWKSAQRSSGARGSSVSATARRWGWPAVVLAPPPQLLLLGPAPGTRGLTSAPFGWPLTPSHRAWQRRSPRSSAERTTRGSRLPIGAHTGRPGPGPQPSTGPALPRTLGSVALCFCRHLLCLGVGTQTMAEAGVCPGPPGPLPTGTVQLAGRKQSGGAAPAVRKFPSGLRARLTSFWGLLIHYQPVMEIWKQAQALVVFKAAASLREEAWLALPTPPAGSPRDLTCNLGCWDPTPLPWAPEGWECLWLFPDPKHLCESLTHRLSLHDVTGRPLPGGAGLQGARGESGCHRLQEPLAMDEQMWAVQ